MSNKFPNVELHGYETVIALEMRDRIREIFASMLFVKRVTVEIYGTTVLDAENMPRPYIRLTSSGSEYAYAMVKALRDLKEELGVEVDVQYLELTAGFLS